MNARELLNGGKVKWAIFTGISIAAISIGMNAWMDHFAMAGEDHVTLSHVEKLAQATNKVALELAKRAASEDAGKDRDRVRCLAGQIKSCDICGNAGVQLADC